MIIICAALMNFTPNYSDSKDEIRMIQDFNDCCGSATNKYSLTMYHNLRQKS